MAKEQRLIDANALRAVLKSEECNCEVFPWAVDNAPTVDAVEVVRCKGCLNYKETIGGKPCGYGRCLHPSGLKAMVFDESFCPYGERREGE